jgi:hypothetical protein
MDLTLSEFVGSHQQPKNVRPHTCLLSLGLIAHSVKHTNFSIGVSHLG